MKTSKFGGALRLIDESLSIAIISHISPDGDTVGSALALYKALKTYGKQPYLFCDDAVPKKLGVIGKTARYNTGALDGYDLAISVDTASFERMGGAKSEFLKAKKTVVIDHHIGNTRFADINIVVEAAATAEIMAEFIRGFGELDEEIARALYAGLVTDTGCFRYSSVTTNTFFVAGLLKGYDIKAHVLTEELMALTDKNVFDLRNRVLSRTKFYRDGKIALIAITLEDFEATGTSAEDTEGIVNMAREVRGVDAAVVMTEHARGVYKVSIRTSDAVNANYIAMQFGGGGHVRASGCRISGTYEEVAERIVKACSDELPF